MAVKKKPKKRPYTEAEKLEVELLTATAFTGGTIDPSRAEELWRTSPEEYGEISDRTRDRIRKSIMKGFES